MNDKIYIQRMKIKLAVHDLQAYKESPHISQNSENIIYFRQLLHELSGGLWHNCLVISFWHIEKGMSISFSLGQSANLVAGAVCRKVQLSNSYAFVD